MRFTTLIIGAALGVVAYNWFTNQDVQTQNRRRFDKPLEHKHAIQDEGAHLRVTELIDEVIHEPDAPETPIKQAFEHALEEKR